MSENVSRTELLAGLRRVSREHGDATVLFHSALATKVGLHPTDYKALGVLDRLGPLSAGELGHHTGLAAASVTNLIDRLAAKGFVHREPDPADRRRVLLRADVSALTHGEFFAAWRRSAPRLWQRYSDDELAVILDFLGAATEQLRTRTGAIADSDVAEAFKQKRHHEAKSTGSRFPSGDDNDGHDDR